MAEVALVAVAAFPPIFNAAAVPVMFVPTNALGVPSAGVTNVGEVANTAKPVPVSSDKAPAKPAEFVKAACLAALLPSIFWIACKILSVAATVPDPLVKPVSTFPITAALVTVAAFPVEVTSPVKFAFVVTLPAVKPAAVPVMLVPTNVVGVPRFGVIRVGLVPNTAKPVPVSSDKAPAKPAELVSVFCLPAIDAVAAAVLPSTFWMACNILSVAATVPAPEVKPVNTLPSTAALVMVVALPVEVTSPVKFAFVVTVAALPVTLPAIGLVTVKPVNVPTDVIAG